MARKPEKPVVAFIRKGDGLYPELDIDKRALDGIAQGQRVRIRIEEFRNQGRHRLYWAILNEVIQATDCALSPERLHELVKLKTGLVEIVSLPDGTVYALPGSIAFDKISEAEFIAFLEKAVFWLTETYGYAPDIERTAA